MRPEAGASRNMRANGSNGLSGSNGPIGSHARGLRQRLAVGRARLPLGSGAYQVFILGVSLYAIIALAAETLLRLDRETLHILARADAAACVLFLVDFLVSLIRAPRRGHYFLRWGWIDLASSIPTVRVLRWGRFARVVRVVRVLRGVRATRTLAAFVLGRRAEGVFFAVASLALLLVLLGSMTVLQFELPGGGNIRTGEDAVWWAFSTVATIGNSNFYPVTVGGRAVALVLMIAGVGLFGTFAGFVASWFLAPGERRRKVELDDLLAEIQELRREMAAPTTERRSPGATGTQEEHG